MCRGRVTVLTVLLCALFGMMLPAARAQDEAAAKKPAATAPDSAHRRKRIAVVNFEVPPAVMRGWFPDGSYSGDISDRISGVLSDMLITALVKTQAFDVIERTELDKVLAEHKLSQSNILDPATAPVAMKILGVDMILGGKLTEFGVKEKKAGGGLLGIASGAILGVGIDMKNSTARVKIDGRIVDTTTAKILFADFGEAENKEGSLALVGTNFKNFFGGLSMGSQEWTDSRIGRATRDAVDQFVGKVLVFFPVETVVKGVLPNGDIILDLGRFSGVKVGDEFDLMRETIMRDDETGEEIYRDRKALGVIKVTEVQDERCKCTPTGVLPEPPKRGDYAVLKKAPPADTGKDKKKK